VFVKKGFSQKDIVLSIYIAIRIKNWKLYNPRPP